MIAKLKGTVDHIFTDSVIIDIAGVGYEVFISGKTGQSLVVHAPIILWIDHLFRQDDQQLCGFLDLSERDFFRKLRDVAGVGPRVALKILSLFSPHDIVDIIARQDVASLTRADGVGSKLAQRILLELKNKKWSLSSLSPQPTSVHDAIEGLVHLGYPGIQVMSLVQDLSQKHPEAKAADLIRYALPFLSSQVLR